MAAGALAAVLSRVLPLGASCVLPDVRMLRLAVGCALAATALAGTGAGAGAPRPGVTGLISVSSAGAQANNNSGEGGAPIAMTPDGRYVAFVSAASNLVAGDLNQEADVFVRDRRTGKTVMASVPTPGTVAKVFAATGPVICPAQFPAISANGRYVAFSTCRSLDGKAPDVGNDVWVHDFTSGATTRVTVTYDGTPLNGDAIRPSISDDGRYVAFQSSARNLVRDRCPGDPVAQELCVLLSPASEIYVRDMVRRTTGLVSVGTSGAIGDGDAYNPAISADGHVVTFTSNADNLGSNDHNICLDETPSCADVYARDLRTSTTQLVSVGLDGQAAPATPAIGAGADVAEPASVSSDGRYVAFRSGQTNLVPADAPISSGVFVGDTGVYVRDLKLARTERASVTSSGAPIALGGGSVTIDRTGRYVAFDAVETCGTGATVPRESVAVHDRVTGDTRLLDDVDAGGKEIPCPTSFVSVAPVVGAGGRYVAFGSDATMLVRGDTNKSFDVFVRDEGTALGVGGIVAAAHVTSNTLRIDAVAVYRPARRDVFIRLDVDAMLPVIGAVPSIRYVVTLTRDGQRYQLRATEVAGRSSFGVFRETATGWHYLGDVPGGYGTTGRQVVAAIPFALLGVDSPDGIDRIDVRALR